MPKLLERVLACVLVVLFGAAVAYLLASPGPGRTVAAIAGALAAAALLATRDALSAHRFLNWLRLEGDAPPPRNAGGVWGEIGYRIERALLTSSRKVDEEHERLSQFLSAIDASPNGVLILDAGGQVEWCNSAAADHFGLSADRDRLQRITNLVRAPAFVEYLQRGAYDEPVRFPAPNGRGVLSVAVRRYGNGMRLLLSQDITERERTDAMRRDFVANVSHEIRTPLTVLAGFVEALDTLALDEAERRRVVDHLGEQTRRMQALVADLLTLAQLEGSPWPPVAQWLGVESLLRRIKSDAEALSGGRHDIVLQVAAPCEIAGSETELHSAVANLVNNAVRYTPEGGRIAIRWSLRRGGGAELEVEDSGIGIAREHLARLAERFYRVDQSRSRDTGGTGLGLSIVKHVMHRHGGEMTVRSTPGVGSCFKLVFPARRVRAVAAVPSAPAQPLSIADR